LSVASARGKQGILGGDVQEYRSFHFRSVCSIKGVTRLIFAFARELDSDGRRAVSGSDDGTIKVWDLATSFALLTTVQSGHASSSGPAAVYCCDVVGDGTPRVLTGGNASALKLWG
jgi:WD40 repeat protein